MTGFFCIGEAWENFLRIEQILEFIKEKIPEAPIFLCGKNIFDIMISSEIKAELIEITSEKAKELIEKSDHCDNTFVLGDDVPKLSSQLNKLYFFADRTDHENVMEWWNDFRSENNISDTFYHSEYGSVDCGDRVFGYIFLERASGGNSILYNELNRMVKQYRLTVQALSGAKENVESYIKESPAEAEAEGFVPSEAMQYSVHSYYYCIDDNNKNDWIAVEIEMRNPHKIIGFYTMIFDSGNGIITDDVFYSPF